MFCKLAISSAPMGLTVNFNVRAQNVSLMITTIRQPKNDQYKAFESVLQIGIFWLIMALRYHPPLSTLPALIGGSAFAFNKYPHKPYIF